MSEHAGMVAGATADAIIALLLTRELAAAPQAATESNRWHAFAALWRQQWHPADEDERWIRWIGYVSTALIHFVFAILLLWLAYVRFTATLQQTRGEAGDDIVQVEFIGREVPKIKESRLPSTRQMARSNAIRHAPLPIENKVVSLDEALPSPSQASALQPLQVTEVRIPDNAFVLPPPTPPERVRLPQPSARLRLQEPSLDKSEVQVVTSAIPDTKSAPAAAMSTTPQPPALRLSNVPIPTPDIETAVLERQNIVLRPNTVATPTIAQPTTQPLRAEITPLNRQQSSTPVTSAMPDSRNDDWGGAQRKPSRISTKGTGLFNADGSPRVPLGTAIPGGGLPPSFVEERIADLDRSGSWLKRRPTDYQPGILDRYWVPNETLLAEWVRRSIKEVLIPIPGTSKRIRCSITVLALGGGCGLFDPNMMDVEASARPSPDIPFKHELQEDQQSLGKPPGS